MSACGNCGSSKICTCAFQSDASTTLTGDGRSYAPINWRPNNVPLPRPYAFIYRSLAEQVFPAFSINVPIIFNTNDTPFADSMVIPPQHGTSLSIDRLVAPIAGYYLIGTQVTMNTPAAVGNDIVSIMKNGVLLKAQQIGSADRAPRSLVLLEQMQVNDYVQVVVTTPSGGTSQTDHFSGLLNPITSTSFPIFWAQWMRGL